MIDSAVLAKSGEAVKAGPIGLAVILLLCIACYFLFKSMSKHMRVVRESFPTTDGAPSAAVKPAATTDIQRAELIKTDPAQVEQVEQAEQAAQVTPPVLPSAEADDRPSQPEV